MSIFDSFPSYDTVKGYFSDKFQVISDQFNHYYPIARDEVLKYGKPGFAYINKLALEHPIPALVVANLGFIAIAKKIASLVSHLLNKLTCGFLSRKLTGPLCGVSVIIGGNYAIYEFMNLNLSLHVSLIIPMVVFACVILLHRRLTRAATQTAPISA